jgi:hypothetical protein
MFKKKIRSTVHQFSQLIASKRRQITVKVVGDSLNIEQFYEMKYATIEITALLGLSN